ncbi:hypothetical protein D3C86_1700860 [compost metagenome]
MSLAKSSPDAQFDSIPISDILARTSGSAITSLRSAAILLRRIGGNPAGAITANQIGTVVFSSPCSATVGTVPENISRRLALVVAKPCNLRVLM